MGIVSVCAARSGKGDVRPGIVQSDRNKKRLILKGVKMKEFKEWLDYGRFKGMLQWRNSGKGKFEWEEI